MTTQERKRPQRKRPGRGANIDFDPFEDATAPRAPEPVEPEPATSAPGPEPTEPAPASEPTVSAPSPEPVAPATGQDVALASTAPSVADVVSRLRGLDVAALAAALPAIPDRPETDDDSLVPREETRLEQSEALLNLADLAPWIQGREFEAIREGRLYRQKFPDFDTYCRIVHSKSGRRVNMLVESWRLHEHLLVDVAANFGGAKVNDAHVRALLPLADRCGNEAAGFVLRTFLKTGVSLTGGVLSAAIATIPADWDTPTAWNEEEAGRLLADFIAGPRVLPRDNTAGGGADPVVTAVAQIRSTTEQVVKRAARNPDAVRRLVDELEVVLNELRRRLVD